MCVSNKECFSEFGLRMAIAERISYCYSINQIDSNTKNLLAKYCMQKDFENIYLYITMLKKPATELAEIAAWIHNSKFHSSNF